MKQKGLAPLVIIILIALAVGGYLLYQKQSKFAIAPQSTSGVVASPAPSGTGETANPDLIGANWKTYENKEFKFSLKYPESWNPPSGFEPVHLGKGLRFNLQNYDNTQNDFNVPTISVIITDESLETIKQNIQKDYGGTGSNQERGPLEGVFYTGIGKSEDFRGNILGDQFRADFIFSNGEWIYWFRLWTDPAKKNEHLQLFDQILSTFKFLDQKEPAAEGQLCGGFAGKLCQEGFTCKLDGNYPDAGGKCIKE